MKCPECASPLTDKKHCQRCGWSKKDERNRYQVRQSINSSGKSSNIQVGRDIKINIQNTEAQKPTSVGRQSGNQSDSSPHDQTASKLRTKDIKVFLSYAREDSAVAEKIFLGLQRRGLKIWKDDKSLRIGDVFDNKIKQAIKESDFAITLLSSKSVSKIGYIQKELRQILEMSQFRPRACAFVLPIKLDNCEIPLEIADFNWIEYSDDEESFLDRLSDDIKAHFKEHSEGKI